VNVDVTESLFFRGGDQNSPKTLEISVGEDKGATAGDFTLTAAEFVIDGNQTFDIILNGTAHGDLKLTSNALIIAAGKEFTLDIAGAMAFGTDEISFGTLLLAPGSTFTTTAEVFSTGGTPPTGTQYYQVDNLDVVTNATWTTAGTYQPNTTNGDYVRLDLTDIAPGQTVLTWAGAGNLDLSSFDPWAQQKAYLLELQTQKILYYADNPKDPDELGVPPAFITSDYQPKSRDLGTVTLINKTDIVTNGYPMGGAIGADGNYHIDSSDPDLGADGAGDLFDDFAFTAGLRRYYWDVYVESDGDNPLVAHNYLTADATNVYTQAGAAPGLSLNQTFQTTLRAFENVSEDPETVGRLNIGLYFSGSDTKAETGSHVDLDNFSGTLLLSQTNDAGSGLLTVGAFAEFARGDYETFNFIPRYGHVFGEGDVDTYGGGLLVKATTAAGTYVEGSLRGGVIDNDFHVSRDPWSQTPNIHSYESENSYFGAHLGVGHKLALAEFTNLEGYGRFFWTRVGEDSFTTRAGDQIKIEAIDSARVRTGARVNHSLADNMLKIYLGAAAEWELDGQVKGTTNGDAFVRAADTKGTTGFGELGFVLTPIPGGNFSINAQAFGYTGNIKGGGGSASLNFNF
jgi:hypothetical protein